ncbi:hypothetical protein, partial [Achromobacter ruhlandii]|uniref:hypothetical protein n=1 Tax=Achromobacter ruhlandii TaxID=72557 RepID=UPI001C70547C
MYQCKTEELIALESCAGKWIGWDDMARGTMRGTGGAGANGAKPRPRIAGGPWNVRLHHRQNDSGSISPTDNKEHP